VAAQLRSVSGNARPPYVEFETRPEEDRDATIAAGRIVMKDVDYAIIRALGSKDTVEKTAIEWLDHLDAQAARSSYSREWAKFFREQYNGWKNGGDATKVNGLHVRNWPSISRSQAEALVSSGVYSVEDLADANEEALKRIGMGGRALKERARAYLETAEGGKAAEELAALRVQNATQAEQIETLNRRVAELAAQLDPQPEKRKRA
jgi:hypothetical protein